MYQTTSQVAKELGITHGTLLMFLNRNPSFKPINRISPSNDYLWLPSDVERLKKRPKRGKR